MIIYTIHQMDQPLEIEHHTTTTIGSASIAPFEFKYIATHPTSWDPNSLEIPLNIRLDGCIVPSSSAAEGARISYSHVVVLDGLVDDDTRRAIQKILVNTNNNDRVNDDGVRHLPHEKWERKTADMAGAPPTWGLRPHILGNLLGCNPDNQQEEKQDGASSSVPDALLEIQSRLVTLYPEYQIAYLPSQAIQTRTRHDDEDFENVMDQEEEEEDHLQKSSAPESKRVKRVNEYEKEEHSSSVDCSAILANAAAHGDTFKYHVDADPMSFPPSSWTRSFGEYFNGEPGKPLLVTLLVYINERWERDWGGETIFLDAATDVGICVRPKPGRAILMEQDVVHKVNPPSSLAEGRFRLSLVWKLAFIPKNINYNRKTGGADGCGGEGVRLARREWGQPTSFGSAAKVDAVKKQLLAERNQQQQQQQKEK